MKNIQGVTLLEFLAATALMAILSVTVIPSLRALVQNNRLIVQTNDIVAGLYLARSEAIRRRTHITICKSVNALGSEPGCDDSARWQSGWIVFTDSDGDNQRDAGEPLIRVYPALPEKLTLHANGTLRNRIRFNAKGYSNGYNGRLILCDERGNEYARVLIISSTGRVRLTSHAAQPGGSKVHCPA